MRDDTARWLIAQLEARVAKLESHPTKVDLTLNLGQTLSKLESIDANVKTVLTRTGAIMAAIEDLNTVIDELTVEAVEQRAQLEEMKATLVEVKTILEQSTSQDPAIAAATARIAEQLAALKAVRAEYDAAEEAVDPTPDNVTS